jgi:hypothetical protein
MHLIAGNGPPSLHPPVPMSQPFTVESSSAEITAITGAKSTGGEGNKKASEGSPLPPGRVVARIRITYCLEEEPKPDGYLLDKFETALQVKSVVC